VTQPAQPGKQRDRHQRERLKVESPVRLVEHRVRHEDRRDREPNRQRDPPTLADDGIQADDHRQHENPEVVVLHVGADQRGAHDEQRPGEREIRVAGARARREARQREEHAGVTREGDHRGEAPPDRKSEERHQREMRAVVGRFHRPVALHRGQHAERPVRADDGRAEQVMRDRADDGDAGRQPRP